ncbi:CHAP domain-containing protein [Aeromicrobium chenweiae]|nr:CHAP domain-containing protein [Aeromicrobium chenweiae]
MLTVAVLPGGSAQAASTTTCSGFTACAVKLKSDAGYALVHTRSFWNMRAGHNCTNYVAYRLTTGRTTARPPGTGDAGSWAAAARAHKIPVNAKPVVGAVAWWSKDVVTAGNSGHVAYVEKVHADGSIDISEDNAGGTFRWRKVTKGAGWPTSFIHYPSSDGSPLGTFTSVTADVAGQLDIRGLSGEPDAGLLGPGYLVTLGGPRGAAGVESFAFSTPYFSFQRIKTVKRRGLTTVYLYALNTPLTPGKDVLLGTRNVTIRDVSVTPAPAKLKSSTSARLTPSTIRAATRPKVKITLPAHGPTGRVDVKRGSKVLKTVTFGAGGKHSRIVKLPRQKKGKHSFTVSYRGSSRYLPSTTKVTLRVR